LCIYQRNVKKLGRIYDLLWIITDRGGPFTVHPCFFMLRPRYFVWLHGPFILLQPQKQGVDIIFTNQVHVSKFRFDD